MSASECRGCDLSEPTFVETAQPKLVEPGSNKLRGLATSLGRLPSRTRPVMGGLDLVGLRIILNRANRHAFPLVRLIGCLDRPLADVLVQINWFHLANSEVAHSAWDPSPASPRTSGAATPRRGRVLRTTGPKR